MWEADDGEGGGGGVEGGWGGEHEDFHKKSMKTFTRTYILDEEAAVVDEG